MTLIVDVVFGAIAWYIALVAAYLLVITLAAWFYRRPARSAAEPAYIAVLVPAHNEETHIVATVAALHASAYPEDRRDVIVLSDNSSDATAAQARVAGARVFERVDPDNPGKGQAIDWILATHRDRLAVYDALAVVDADTIVDGLFLQGISDALNEPTVQVVQGAHGISNPTANWRTALTTAGFAMINHLRPMGRNALGCSTELNGNGMAFRTELLLKRGWTAHSVVEDIEMALQLLMDGVMVRFSSDAKVMAEMATSRRQAGPQRKRWEGGRFEIMRMYLPRLLLRFVSTGRLRFLDAFLNLLVPPLSLLVLIQLGALVVGALWFPLWLPVLGASVFITAVHVFAALIAVRAPIQVWGYLVAAPMFLAWKVPIYAGLMLRPRQRQWVRTERNPDTSAASEPTTATRDD